MKFIFLTILYLFCTNYIFPQDSKICWNSNKAISWSDFREINPQECNKVYSALSFCGIILKTNNELIIPYFDTEKSWVILSMKKSKQLLRHERMHFDIVELFARRIRYEFDISVEKDLESIYDKNMILLDNYQDRYDFETKHGIVESEQSCWNEYISDELKKLDKYKTTDKECNFLKE